MAKEDLERFENSPVLEMVDNFFIRVGLLKDPEKMRPVSPRRLNSVNLLQKVIASLRWQSIKDHISRSQTKFPQL